MKPESNSKIAREHLRLIGKISVILAGLTTLALVILAGFFESLPDADYSTTVGHLALMKERLDHAILIGALTLVTLTALTTWVIALYSSFRVAGPLFRLSRNLETLIGCRRSALPPLRKGDRLQQEAAELNAAQRVLVDHHARLRVAIDQCRRDLEGGADDGALEARVLELRRLANNAQL